MDKKRMKNSNKNVIHMKRVIAAKMRACYINGKSLEYTSLQHKFHSLQSNG